MSRHPEVCSSSAPFEATKPGRALRGPGLAGDSDGRRQRLSQGARRRAKGPGQRCPCRSAHRCEGPRTRPPGANPPATRPGPLFAPRAPSRSEWLPSSQIRIEAGGPRQQPEAAPTNRGLSSKGQATSDPRAAQLHCWKPTRPWDGSSNSHRPPRRTGPAPQAGTQPSSLQEFSPATPISPTKPTGPHPPLSHELSERL